jgi:serine/threonine protein kinase
MVLFEMLTGQSPFDKPTADEALLAVMRVTPPPVSTRQPMVSRDLDRVVARSLAKPLASRYQSATTLADDLRRVKALLDAEAAQSAAPDVTAKTPARPILPWAVALAVLAGAVGWWLFGR